jgi:glyoxylase-like metal-dependent hydrolase (beta-lactamase superfamily II)/rhodanese-related sulfurtransferase
MQVEVLPTEELGDRSYVVHDGTTAVVVDPQRDIDRVEEVLADRGLTVGAVVETHVHNDYVTGGVELARRTGARYVLNAADDVRFERHGVRDGDELRVGALTVRAVATPGHTDTHLSYLVSADGDDSPPAIFTGGSLLYGSVGRTDLVDAGRTHELARAQYRSAHRLAAELDDATRVFPTHGFGSFCSAGQATGGETSTIGEERARNDALTEPDEDAFVEALVAGLTAYPAYYVHMAPLNRQGPAAPDLSPPEPVDPDQLRKRIAAGEWVVDLRDRTAYAADHVAGTIGIPLDPQTATYVGWLMPWGAPLTLVGTSGEQVAEAQRQLVRIGIDRPAGAAVGSPIELAGADGTRGYPRARFADLMTMPADDVVLDVRRADERAAGSVPGSVHVPIHELLDRLDELPDARLWVHCATGFRSAIAASLLDRAGREVVYVDDDYQSAVSAGLATG